MNDNIDLGDLFLVIVMLGVGLIIGWVGGTTTAYQSIKQQAIKAGRAHYEVDNTGRVTFVWNTK